MSEFCLDCQEQAQTCPTCELDAVIRSFPREVPVTAYLGMMRLLMRDRKHRDA